MRTKMLVLVGVTFLSMVSVGCQEGQCDPGYEADRIYCKPIPDAGSDGAASDGAPVSGDFGASCTSTSNNCSGTSNYCAIQPGQPTGFCTAKDCKNNTALCPSGWKCYDMGLSFVPSFCTVDGDAAPSGADGSADTASNPSGDATQDGASDSAVSDGSSTDANTADTAAPSSNFGTECTKANAATVCVGASNTCAVQPGQTTGYCSVTGCQATPSLCPPNWTCMPFAGGVCTKP